MDHRAARAPPTSTMVAAATGALDSRKRRLDNHSSTEANGSDTWGIGPMRVRRDDPATSSFHSASTSIVEGVMGFGSIYDQVTESMSSDCVGSNNARTLVEPLPVELPQQNGVSFQTDDNVNGKKRFRAGSLGDSGPAPPHRNAGSSLFPMMPAPRKMTSFTPISRPIEQAADMITGDEVFEAIKEGSQSMMEKLAISQQQTQENTQTQTLEESQSGVVIRLKLHRQVAQAISAHQRTELEHHGLYHIELHRLNPRVSLGRDVFAKIFDRSPSNTSGIDPLKLSRTHCIIECVTDENTNHVAAFITDKSTNGVRIGGRALVKNTRHQLAHGEVVTLLTSSSGSVLLGYEVEDPHVLGAQVVEAPKQAVMPSGLRKEDTLKLQEYTLGVLFSSPIVGKDIHGKYHPIAELDIKREYTILQQSLVEASRLARGSVAGTPAYSSGMSSSLIQCPPRVNVCAKFANTENFRTIVTLGCRALHFSGHGDEKHLYFEDGMGLVHPIPHSSLQELFTAGNGGNGLRLAFVSACSSAPLAHAFVACGIPHVIGVRINQKIEDHAAIEFTKSFYLALATGKTVGDSFTIAQQSVAKSPNIRGPNEVADKFFLLPEGGDHTEVIFPLATTDAKNARELEPVQMQQFPQLWFNDLPAICHGFCNRAVEVYKICLALMLTQSRVTRLVTICGEEGIGKTAVAHAVANYVGPRVTSEGGVKVISVARLALLEREENVDRVQRGVNISQTKSRLFVRLEGMINEHLSQHRARVVANAEQMLLVLDGCDFFLQSDVRRELFRMFLSDLLTNNPPLKVVITARSSLSTDGSVAGNGERVYALSRFNAKMAAKMLLSITNRQIRFDELKRSSAQSNEKLEVVASHPALAATMGIPKKIADLAGKLTVMAMDDVRVGTDDMQMER